MKVNVALLRKVRKLIKEEPKRLYMGSWGTTRMTNPGAPPCKTTACLAGWAVLAATPKKRWSKLFSKGSNASFNDSIRFSVDERAAKLMGIKLLDCPFYKYSWTGKDVIRWIDRQISTATKSKGGN